MTTSRQRCSRPRLGVEVVETFELVPLGGGVGGELEDEGDVGPVAEGDQEGAQEVAGVFAVVAEVEDAGVDEAAEGEGTHRDTRGGGGTTRSRPARWSLRTSAVLGPADAVGGPLAEQGANVAFVAVLDAAADAGHALEARLGNGRGDGVDPGLRPVDDADRAGRRRRGGTGGRT